MQKKASMEEILKKYKKNVAFLILFLFFLAVLGLFLNLFPDMFNPVISEKRLSDITIGEAFFIAVIISILNK